MRGGATRWAALAWAGALSAACGEDPVSVDPAVAPFVGTWDAVVFTVTADAPPYTVADILSLGSFFISVEPSGHYTATLEVFGFPDVEFGQVSVAGSTLTIEPDDGPPTPSTYSFAGPDYLTLDGPTEFDFNLDGTDEPAQAHIELERR